MAGEDPAYCVWVRGQPCLLRGGDCWGPVEAHHAGRRPGLQVKAHDDTCIPLCHRHHVEHLHGLTGRFKGWTKERLRRWQDAQIQAVRQRYAEGPVALPDWF